MNTTDSIYAGMFATFLQDGLKIELLNQENNIIYISLPEDSYAYHLTDNIKCAEDYAKSMKEKVFHGLLGTTVRVKLRVRKGVLWTKEMGNKNYEENIGTVVQTFGI